MKAGHLCCFLYVTSFFLVTEVSSLIQGSYGGICLNECERGSSYPYCETTAHGWDYCSNIAGVTSYTYGKVCREDHQCGFHKEKYLWCYYDDSDNWGYCSLYPDEAIITYNGKACKKRDPCTESSRLYSSWNWCYTDDNNWDYCKGTNTITDNDHLTRLGYHCTDSCEMHGRNTYHTCSYQYLLHVIILGYWLRSSSDYCSANPDSTYQGDACRSNHSCDRYGETYYWCYKQKSSWDYCSPIENCGYWPLSPLRVKRQVETNVVCRLPTASHNFEITMSSPNQTNNQLRPISGRQMCQVQVTIAQWDRTAIDRGTRAGTLCETDKYRIDLQGTFTENNIVMANIQVQSNGQNSQSVAGLHVPVGVTFSIRRFRRALVESAQRQRFITMRYRHI